jgi:hypothetical protein
LAVLVGCLGVPLDLAGQVERTVVIKGVVVDEAGMPVGNSRVAVHPPFGKKIEVVAAGGEFSIEASAVGGELVLTARNETGELQGMEMLRGRPDGPMRVTLRKARELVVTVTDPAQQPIAGARVGVDMGNNFLRRGTIAEELTNDKGLAVLRFAADAAVQCVFAVKRDVGVNSKPLVVGPLAPQTLVLGDNSTIAMRVIDDEDKPLAGVSIWPSWAGQFAFPARELEELRVVTDAMGQATLRMLPAAISNSIGFGVELKGYAVIQPIRYDSRAAPKEITARLAPLITLRGKVKGADGTPPVGHTEVFAGGAGYRPQEPNGSFGPRWRAGETGAGFKASCDESGAFELQVARNQYYALVAWSSPQQGRKDSLVSPIQMRVVGGESLADELSFTLGPGTRVHGRVTRVQNRTQVSVLPSAPMDLAWRDAESYAKLPREQRLPNPENKTVEIAPALIQTVWTDGEGEFEFYVPPGRYVLSAKGYGGEPKTVEVTDQAEIKADFDASGAPPALARAAANPQLQPVRRPFDRPPAANVIDLTGRVVLQADRERGIGNVSVRRIDLGTRLGAAPEAVSSSMVTSDADGTFKMRRVEGDSLLICSTADGLLSSIVKIPATAKEVSIPLAPAATVRGRVVDSQTKKPIVGQQIDTSIRTDELMSTSLTPYAITDARGEFVLLGLPPGWPISVRLLSTPRSTPVGGAPFGSMRWTMLKTVTPPKSQVLDLGDVIARQLPPSTPTPTLDQVISHAMRNTYSQVGRLEGELGRAELLGKPLLVFATESASDVCRQFFQLWCALDEQGAEAGQNRELVELGEQFVLLAVDATRINRRANVFQTILNQAKLGQPAANDAGLAILRPDGEVIATTTGGELSSGGKLDVEKLVSFLRQHVPKVSDAEKLLDGALAEAKRDSKRVLVFQNAPLSAPSALISLFLQSQNELLAKDYVCLTLAERRAGGAAAIQRAGGEVSVNPWIAILDESGKRLAMSKYEPPAAEAEDFPSFAGQVERMLKGTARSLSEVEIQGIVRSLWVP